MNVMVNNVTLLVAVLIAELDIVESVYKKGEEKAEVSTFCTLCSLALQMLLYNNCHCNCIYISAGHQLVEDHTTPALFFHALSVVNLDCQRL